MQLLGGRVNLIKAPFLLVVMGLILSLSCNLSAATAVQFNTERNASCWQLIEQNKPGFCRLYFQMSGIKADTIYAKQEQLVRSVSEYPAKRSAYPTSFQQLEYALQFFHYSSEHFKIRNNLVFIRSDDGAMQLNMGILTSASSGYSYLLADSDNQLKQLVNGMNDLDNLSSRYRRGIEQLFQD